MKCLDRRDRHEALLALTLNEWPSDQTKLRFEHSIRAIVANESPGSSSIVTGRPKPTGSIHAHDILNINFR